MAGCSRTITPDRSAGCAGVVEVGQEAPAVEGVRQEGSEAQHSPGELEVVHPEGKADALAVEDTAAGKDWTIDRPLP